MGNSLGKKIVLVTGGTGRIGLAVAKRLLELGAKVILADIVEEKLETLEKELCKKYPKQVIGYKCDITKSEDIRILLENSQDIIGEITSVVHSAYPISRTWGTKLEELTEDIVADHLKQQLGSSIMLSKQVLERFKKKNGGELVHISSIQGIAAPKFDHYIGTDMSSPIEYSAIKAGIISITKWLAKYYAGNSIRVNCVSPGGIFANQQEVFIENYRKSCINFGMLSGEQVAGMVCFLVSDESAAVNGQNIIVDDGWSL